MAKVPTLAEWYESQYVHSVGLSKTEGGTKYRQFLKGFPAASKRHPWTSMNGKTRLAMFLRLKYLYPLNHGGYTCSVLSVRVPSDGSHTSHLKTGGPDAVTHYAYVYWRRGQEDGLPEYICIAPTYVSRDGEYRGRFIRYTAFAAAYETLTETLAPFEEEVLSAIPAGLGLLVSVYPGSASDTILARLSALRLQISALAVALALDIGRVRRGTLMVHTSGLYVRAIDWFVHRAPHLVEFSLDFIGADDSLRFAQGSPEATWGGCGQKLVPMTIREVLQNGDFDFSAWRELAATQLVGDFVVNFVAPCFALYGQWSYLEDIDSALFENEAMEERFSRSGATEAVLGALRDARRGLGAVAPPSYHSDELSARVYSDVKYAQSFLQLSGTAMFHVMEHAGFAMRSVEPFVRRASLQEPNVVGSFATEDSAARHLFELAYGAHCLHTLAGIAHTDLHGNNLAFYAWGRVYSSRSQAGESVYEAVFDDPVVAYVAGPRGEADTYVFPAGGDCCCIVDYSRCILGPAFRSRLGAGRDPQYAARFYHDQVNRVVRTLHRYAPDFVVQNQDAIKAVVLTDFEALFPVLCAVDFIAIGASMGAILRVAAENRADPLALRAFLVAPEGIVLAGRIEAAGREALVAGLHGLVAERSHVKTSFPGAAILEKLFDHWRFPRWAAREPRRVRTAELVDAYRYSSELKYSCTDYARFPPWARLDEIERHLGPVKVQDLFGRGPEAFLETIFPSARPVVLAEQLRAEQEKLDGAPVSTESSWLDE
jgi:hypothetical protein